MKPEFENIPLQNNEEQKRFELDVNEYTAFINYGGLGNQIALVHTEVPKELAGLGVGSALVEKTLQYIENQQKTLLPFCPFVFAYIKKHPEWKRIVDTKFKAYDQL